MTAKLPWVEMVGFAGSRRVVRAKGESGTEYVVCPDGAWWSAHADEGRLEARDRVDLRGLYRTREDAQRAAQQIENRIFVRATEAHEPFALASGDD
jgi:hypothetical protein